MTFRNLNVIGGKTSQRFPIKDYKFYGMDEFSNGFSSCDTGKAFQKMWNTFNLVATPDSLNEKPPGPVTTDPNPSKEKTKKNSSKRSKRALFPTESNTEDLVSPGKKVKPNSLESEIEAHRIGR